MTLNKNSSILRLDSVVGALMVIEVVLGPGWILANEPCPPVLDFNVPPLLAVDAYLRAVNGGDLNQDGHTDLVSANGEDGSVSVFVGSGDGSFELLSTLAVGDWTAALEIADVDADRRLDMVVAHRRAGEVSVLLGRGDGSFDEPLRSPVGEEPESIILGDFDEDGAFDVATLNVRSHDISILLGKGDGTFVAESRLPVGQELASLMGADLNQDGSLDLAATLYSSDLVRIWAGNGDGSFEAPLDASAFSPSSLVTADLDEDGNPDLIASDREGLSVLLGNGDLSFRPALRFPGLPEQTGLAILPAGPDAPPNILVLTTSNVSVVRSRGDGSLGPPGPSFLSGATTSPSVFLADLDEDGFVDLVRINAGSPWSGLSILFGTGGGSFEAPLSFRAGGTTPGGPDSVLCSDFDRDGLFDAATTIDGEDAILILLSNGDGTLREKQRIASTNGPNFLHGADLDGDGILDLVVGKGRSVSREISVLPGLGDGSFGEERTYPAGLSSLMLVGTDFDADGWLDIAAADIEKGAVIILPGLEGGQFGPPLEVPLVAVHSVAVGDLNRDGHVDVVAGRAGGPAILLGNGDRTFQPATGLDSLNSSAVIVVDLNLDGMLDIASASTLGDLRRFDAAAVHLGNGDGTFAAETRFPAGIVPTSIAAGDLDGDGIPDLLVASRESRSVSVLTGKGDGSFNAQRSFPGGGEWAKATTGDVDGDADLDIIVASQRALSVSVLLNVSAPCGPTFLRGDANGDEALDISDPIRILGSLFLHARPVSCADAADANDDGLLDASDGVFLLGYIFLGTETLPSPAGICGPDPTEDGHDCAGASNCSP